MNKLQIFLATFLLGVVFLAAPPSHSQTGRNYAILIVGDEGDAESSRREKVLISEIAKTVRKTNASAKLPLLSYHFNKERERVYCEKKLNVLKEDLLFVGVVRLENNVPRKIDYRIDRIVNPARAAEDVLARYQELVDEARPKAIEIPPVNPSPSPSQTPAVAPSVSNSTKPGWRIQLGSFSQLKYAEEQAAELEAIGYEANIGRTASGDTALFKVTVGPFEDRQSAAEALQTLKEKGFEQGFLVEVAPSNGDKSNGDQPSGGVR